MARLSKPLRPGTLAIDLGTTGGRAVICFNNDSDSRAPIVINHTARSLYLQPGALINFPSNADLLSDDDIPAISRLLDSECGILTLPVKMIPYLIRMHALTRAGRQGHDKIVKGFCKEIPQLGAFYTKFQSLEIDEQELVIHRSCKVFAALLQHIARYAERQAHQAGIKLERIALTIPSNWDNWTQKFALKMIAKVWPTVKDCNIHVVYEAEAVGHYLFRLLDIRAKKHPLRVLIVDWGGHTLNTTIVELQPGRKVGNTGPVFFDLGNIQCEHLGSALYVSALKEHIIEEIRLENVDIGGNTPDHFVETALNYFLNRKLHKLHKGQGSMTLVGEISPDHPASLSIDKATLDRLYKTYIGNGISKIRRLMVKLSQDKAKSPVDFDLAVFANGGTLKNEFIHEELTGYAQEKGINYINAHVADVAGDYRSIVSRGAALAVANSVSLRDYMRTSIFAIRPSKFMPVTENVPVIWNGGISIQCDLNLLGQHGATVSLVCQPFAYNRNAEAIPLYKTFELEVIPQLKQDTYKFQMHFKLASDDENKGEIILQYWVGENKTPQALPPQTLYFDPGQTVAFIERNENETIYNLNDEQFHRKGSRLYRIWQDEQIDKASEFWRQAIVDDIEIPDLDDTDLADAIGYPREKPKVKAGPSSSQTSTRSTGQSSGSRRSKRAADTRLSVSEGATSLRQSKKSSTRRQEPKTVYQTKGQDTSKSPQRKSSSKAKGKQPLRPEQPPILSSKAGKIDTHVVSNRANRILQPNPNLARDPGQAVVISDSDSSEDDDEDTGDEQDDDDDNNGNENHGNDKEGVVSGIPLEPQAATTTDARELPPGIVGATDMAASGGPADSSGRVGRSRISISRTSSRPSNAAEIKTLFRESLPGGRELTLPDAQLQQLVELIREVFHWRRALEGWWDENFEMLYN